MPIIMGKRGFTLVELLIVIAIIGILATTIVTSLSKAREKAADAKTKAQLSSLKEAAEIYYDTHGAYGLGPSASCSGGMFGDPDSGVHSYTDCSNYPGGCSITHLKCNSDGMAYAVSANLTGSGTYWCVDSLGHSGEAATDPGQVTVCPIAE